MRRVKERVPGVNATVIDFDRKTAVVTFDPDKANTTRLTQATTEAGFPLKLIAKP